MMRRLAVLALCVGTTAVSCGSNSGAYSRQLVTTPIVDNALDFLYFAIARRAKLEAWFCMRGYVDTITQNVIVQNISPVFVDSADGMNIHGRPDGCREGPDSSSIIGTVHFHPDMNQCEFSDVDIVTAHWLKYKSSALMCRDSLDTLPHLKLVLRKQIDSAYRVLPDVKGGGSDVPIREFTPVYRYSRKPER